ncbi:hypothetical protein EGM_15516, partial [Macaca fascicularis]
DDSLERVKSALDIFSVIIYTVTFFLGLAGNGLVIGVAGFHMSCTVSMVRYLKLPVADFIIIFPLPLQLVMVALQYHWPFGQLLCKLNSTMYIFNFLASVFLLTLISVDHCLPIWSRNHCTSVKATLGPLKAWLLAICFSVPCLIFKETRGGKCHLLVQPNEAQGSHQLWKEMIIPWHQTLVTTARFFFGFILPLAMITGCYILVALKLRERQLVRVLATAVTTFFLCWLPLQVSLWLDFTSSQEDREGLNQVALLISHLASSMAFINSCLNPVLYVFTGHDFWEHLLHSLIAALEQALSEEPD